MLKCFAKVFFIENEEISIRIFYYLTNQVSNIHQKWSNKHFWVRKFVFKKEKREQVRDCTSTSYTIFLLFSRQFIFQYKQHKATHIIFDWFLFIYFSISMFHFAICHKTQRESNNTRRREKKSNTNKTYKFSLKKASNNFLSRKKYGEEKVLEQIWNFSFWKKNQFFSFKNNIKCGNWKKKIK